MVFIWSFSAQIQKVVGTPPPPSKGFRLFSNEVLTFFWLGRIINLRYWGMRLEERKRLPMVKVGF